MSLWFFLGTWFHWGWLSIKASKTKLETNVNHFFVGLLYLKSMIDWPVYSTIEWFFTKFGSIDSLMTNVSPMRLGSMFIGWLTFHRIWLAFDGLHLVDRVLLGGWRAFGRVSASLIGSPASHEPFVNEATTGSRTLSPTGFFLFSWLIYVFFVPHSHFFLSSAAIGLRRWANQLIAHFPLFA